MPENPPLELTPAQIAILQNLLKAGFEFAQLPHVVRYLPVEKNGFVALLDPSAGKLQPFGVAGRRIGDGVGVLVDKAEGKSFVWKDKSVPATPTLLEAFEEFKNELANLLNGPAQ
ncbi:MAG: hypothetical protein ACM3NO_09530 [Deltaproteobacteria bacterium]